MGAPGGLCVVGCVRVVTGGKPPTTSVHHRPQHLILSYQFNITASSAGIYSTVGPGSLFLYEVETKVDF